MSMMTEAKDNETAEERGMRRLWLAVVTQAFRDALLTDDVSPRERRNRWSSTAASSTSNVPSIRERARNWLLGGKAEFVEVCANAGLDPDAVRASASRMLSNEKTVRVARSIFFAASHQEGADVCAVRDAGELRN